MGREATAKATTRDLRRALGAGALVTLDEQNEAVRVLAASLNSAHDRITELGQALAGLEKLVRAIDKEAAVQRDEWHTFHWRPWWSRWAWLLVGR